MLNCCRAGFSVTSIKKFVDRRFTVISKMPKKKFGPEQQRLQYLSFIASLGGSPPKERPSGLKGKEIGLWYAARSKAKKLNPKHKTADVVTLDTTGIDVAHIRDVIALSKKAGLGLQPSTSDEVSFLSCTSLNEDLEEFREATTHDLESHVDKGDQIRTYLLDQLSTNFDPTVPPKKLLVRRVELDAEIQRELHSKQLSCSYTHMLKTRSKLPAFDLRNDITNTVKNNQVLVISGETGCGKTTQIPQFLLESEVSRGNGSVTRIVVTQPRRISAISVAERVAAERGESIGNSIGYQVQLERQYPRRIPGSIMYVTTGMLLQWLHSDPLLENISHVIVDEVHEREFLGDFLLTVLRNIAKLRPELRIILMSATLNADEISAYFNNCLKLHIPGRLFPVQTFFLEDVLRMTCFWLPDAAIANMAREQKSYLTRRYIGEGLSKGDARKATNERNNEFHKWLMEQKDQSPNGLKILRTVDVDAYPMSDLIVHLTNYILQTSDHGSILIFVPGIAAIRETIKQMRANNPHLFGESSNLVRIYPLHSQLAVSKQRGLFDPPPPGQRKVIVATNIAETSITIEDVVYVIDCGRIKVTNYDASSNTNSLAPMLVSRANAAQRRGRAGRVRLGFCYHLFSKFVYDNIMPEFLLPEMLRMRLEDVILRIKLLQLGSVSEFLANCMSPPDQKAVERTLHFLHEIQALSLSDGTFGKDHEHLSRQQRKLTARQLRKQRKQMARNATKNANVIVISDDDDDGGKDANSQPGPLPSKSSYVGLPGDNAPLSPLGEHLARLPMNPQLAKLLILGALFGCLEPALAVASCLNYRDPFEIPLDKQISAAKGRLGLSQNTLSDHWVYVTVVQNFRQLTSGVERYRFCQEYFIRDNVVSEIIRLMGDYARLLHEYRYIATPSPTDPGANINMNNFPLFRAILCGALFPNILKLVPQIKDGRVCRPKVHARPSEGDISINPKSVNGNVWPADPVWMVYYAKTRMDNSTCSTVLDTTIIPLRPVLFFSGSIQSNLIDSTVFTVDNWIKVQANPVLFRLIRDLRACLDDILESKFRCPSVTNWDPSSAEGRVLHTVVNLLANELVPTVQTQRYPWEPKTLERPSGGDGVQSSQSKLTAPHLDNQKQDV